MGWIKRNLIFVIGCVVAVALLGAAGFYTYQGWSRNTEAFSKLNEIYNTLSSLKSQQPSPGNEVHNNTAIARDQQKQVQEWIGSARAYFQSIPAIPAGTVTSEAFASSLRRTVDQLQHAAEESGVTLPPKYDFSFSAERPLVRFAAGSLEPLATQLGEVKLMSDILFAARVNALDSIQRIRVSDEDANGPAGDYTDLHAVTNELAVVTPYVVTFRCFTPELARVLAAFATAPNTFLIKAINVQPASSVVATDGAGGADAAAPQAYMGDREAMLLARMRGRGMPVLPPAQQMQPVSKGGLQTVLKEQLLRVTMEVGLVKLLPKS